MDGMVRGLDGTDGGKVDDLSVFIFFHVGNDKFAEQVMAFEI